MTTVEIDALSVTKGDRVVVRDLDLTVPAGTVTALIGPSGSGKTTVLRSVAGLDAATAGTIRIGGTDVTEAEPAHRDVALVFQMPALLTSRTAGSNISFPLEVRRRSIEEIRNRVTAEARALHIEALLERRSSTLSLGEAQVVQIARAIVRQPSVLLLDEPFSKIDAPNAERLRRELTTIQRGFGVTTLVSTNDPMDAMAMADQVAVIDRGQLTQVGAPLDVYDRPRTVSAAMLTGDADVIKVEVTGDVDGSWLVAPGMRIRAWQPALAAHRGRRHQLVVRPSWWQLDAASTVRAVVERVDGSNAMRRLRCRVADRSVAVQLFDQPSDPVAVGDEIGLRLDRYVLIDPRDGFRLDLG